jgi:hypothetical protein
MAEDVLHQIHRIPRRITRSPQPSCHLQRIVGFSKRGVARARNSDARRKAHGEVEFVFLAEVELANESIRFIAPPEEVGPASSSRVELGAGASLSRDSRAGDRSQRGHSGQFGHRLPLEQDSGRP